jgi:hypothetical protein
MAQPDIELDDLSNLSNITGYESSDLYPGVHQDPDQDLDLVPIEGLGLVPVGGVPLNIPEVEREEQRSMWDLFSDLTRGDMAVIALGVAAIGIAITLRMHDNGSSVFQERKVLDFKYVKSSVKSYVEQIDEGVDKKMMRALACVVTDLVDKCKKNNWERLAWNELESVLNLCCAFQKRDDSAINKIETTYIQKNIDKKTLIKWVTDLIQKTDPEISDDTGLKDDALDSVLNVALDPFDFQNIVNLIVQETTRTAELLDVGIVRFPTKVNPFVKMYRIRITGGFYGHRILGITFRRVAYLSVEITSRKYYLREIEYC